MSTGTVREAGCAGFGADNSWVFTPTLKGTATFSQRSVTTEESGVTVVEVIAECFVKLRRLWFHGNPKRISA